MDGTGSDEQLSVPADTREQLVRAAERLFAGHGINGVSLREVNRAAGQNNTAAVQYYFGDRNGLVVAILSRHRRDDEIRRHALLDQYENDGGNDLRALAAALVNPLAAKLADPDGGREYLQIAAEYYSRATMEDLIQHRIPDSSISRWHRLLNPLVPKAEAKLLHSRFPAIRFALFEMSRRAAAPARKDDQLFTSHLTDLVMAVLSAPPSEHTKRLIERQPGRRSR